MAQVAPGGYPGPGGYGGGYYGQPMGYGPQPGGYPPPHPMGVQPGAYPPVQQQPVPIQNNITVVTSQPTGHSGGPDNPNWQVGLCECCHNCGTCALVFFCEPIAECVASNKLNENCCYPCCCPCCCPCCGMVALSVRFRTLHHIEMGMCQEACCWLYCRMCMTCRLLNEMRLRGHN